MATFTSTPGSITIIYTDQADDAVLLSATALIDDATAAEFVAWAMDKYKASEAAATPQGAFATWGADCFNQAIAALHAVNKQAAADAASANVQPPAVTILS